MVELNHNNNINKSTENIRTGWENPDIWAGAAESNLLIDDTLTNDFDSNEWDW